MNKPTENWIRISKKKKNTRRPGKTYTKKAAYQRDKNQETWVGTKPKTPIDPSYEGQR